MSLGVAHFALGAACTLAVVALVAPRTRYRTTVAVAGGLWGMAPDAHWLLPGLRESTKPAIHDSVLANVFWFHGLLDTHDGAHSPTVAAAFLGLLGVVAFLTEFRRARLASRTADQRNRGEADATAD